MLLPLIIGSKVPQGEPAWDVLMCLKDIVELVVVPVHTEETVTFLDSKISERSALVVTNVSCVPLAIVRNDIRRAIQHKYSNLTEVHVAKKVTFSCRPFLRFPTFER